MPTANFAKARTAGLLALTLIIATTGFSYQAQAGSILIEKPSQDMDSRHDDCESRRDVKWYFKDKYELQHIDVSKTHDYYIYRVSGLLPAKAAAFSAESFDSGDHQLKKKDHDYVRYVVLYDACDHRIIEQIQPRKMVE